MSLSPQVCKKSYKVKIPTLGENCEFWLITVTDESGITNPSKDHAYLTDSGKLYIYNGKTLIQVNCDICFTQEERDKLEGIEEGANKYVLPVATDNALGGIKTGFTQTEKQYAVEVTEEGQAYVTVPWNDTVYTLPVADTDTLGGVKLGYSQNGKNYPVVKDSEGKIYVAVPWEEYSLPQAETNTLGGIKTGYEKQGQNYPVLVDVDGNAYVNVPWTNTDTKYNVVSTTENGLAPMLPTENAEKKFLNGDGEWVEVNESINGNTVTGSTFSGETSDCGVEITKVVGKTTQQTTNGYQLFDASKLPTKSQGGATVTNNNDGSFTISGNGSLTDNFHFFYTYTHDETLKLLKKGNLYLKGTKARPSVGILLAKESGNYFDKSLKLEDSVSAEITQEMLNDPNSRLQIYFYGREGETIVSGAFKPMLYQDGDGTWEPFTGGKPAPNPDYAMDIENAEISEIVSYGKNIIANIPSDGVVHTRCTYRFNDVTKELTVNATGNDAYVGEVSSKGNSYKTTNGTLYLVPKNATKVYFRSEKGVFNSVNITFYNEEKISLGFAGLNYTIPKNTKYVSFRIGVNPSTSGTSYSDRVYASFDEISGDYVDGNYEEVETSLTLAQDDIYQQGTITRARKQVVFDGSSDEIFSMEAIGTTNRFITDILESHPSISTPNGICNRFKFEGNYTIDKEHFYVQRNQVYIFINADRVNSKEELRQWLSTHNTVVEYELATPTTEEFKVPTIPSYEPYTEISTNSVVDPTITFRPLPFTTCLVGEATEEESGYMPPLSGNSNEFLNGNGQWATPPNTTYGVATTSKNGLMSATDKSRLDQLWAKFDSMVFFTED